MKTKLSLLILVSCFFCLLSLNAQIPQGFNYQAIVRNSSGDVIQNQNVKVKVAIQKFDGTVLWDEEHSLTTTQFGLVTFVVGTGPNLTGSVTDFSTIDWTAQTLYLKTYVQYPVPGSYTPMGTTQIWSVPYALRSKESEQWKTSGANIYRPSGNVGIGVTNPLSKVVVQPDASWDDSTPLFEVRNKIGVPVLAVYNNGVRILVDHTFSKGLKGGFAVGGWDQTKAGKTVDFMTISPDSIRFNINNDNAKGLKGGFAVGGYDITTKAGINQDFMYITPQTSNNGQYNTFLGYQAGYKNQSTGLFNSFIGYNAGFENISGKYNVDVGYQTGYNAPNTSYNTLIGFQAGYNLKAVTDLAHEGSQNLMLGFQAGMNTTIGYQSVVLGVISGLNWQSGSANVFIGYAAGAGSTEPSAQNYETYIGYGAGSHMITGDDNVYIGSKAGNENRYGTRNVLIGASVNYTTGGRTNTLNDNVYIGCGAAAANNAGINNVIIGSGSGGGNTGSSNVFIGYKAGSAETGSNKLYIANSETTTPLIYGDFSTPAVRINGSLCYTGTIGTCSDERYKKQIFEITDALNIIEKTRGVYYYWRKEDFPDMPFNNNRQIGVIAQEIENNLPELVSTDNLGYKMVDYSKLTPVLIEAIKEQQEQIESQKIENQQLKSELQALREEVEEIKALQSKEGSK
jgi:hypothetical protein